VSGHEQLRVTDNNGLPHETAVAWALHREQWPVDIIGRFTVEGEPVSKARARFTKRGSKTVAYTPESVKQAEQAVAWRFRQATPGYVIDPDATYGVFAVFFAGTRQRRDVDNMLKLICDGLNGVAWKDDAQVTEVSARRGHDAPENARTEVLVYRVGMKQRPMATCEQCRTEYPTYNSWKDRRFCTDECHLAWRAARRQAECQHCGATFDRGNDPRRKFCSRECSSKSRTVRLTCETCGAEFGRWQCHVRAKNYCSPKCRDAALIQNRKGKPKGTCRVCGGGVSRPEYQRCNACRLAGAKVPPITDLSTRCQVCGELAADAVCESCAQGGDAA